MISYHTYVNSGKRELLDRKTIIPCDFEGSGEKQMFKFFKLWSSLFQKIKWSKVKVISI